MPIDKSWMQLSRSDPKYDQGVTEFLDYAYSHDKWVEDDMIICPCKVCGLNRDILVRSEVHWHLLRYGIKPHYTFWNLHGEADDDNSDESEDDSNSEFDRGADNGATPMELCDDMQDLIEEIFPQDPNEDAQRFYKLLKEAETPLYEGCKKYSNLSFIVKLMHIKCSNTWSNKSFNMLLELLKDAFPTCEKLPNPIMVQRRLFKNSVFIMRELTHARMTV